MDSSEFTRNLTKKCLNFSILVEEVGDDDYLVTADMLIHDDVDDERTLDEEEGEDLEDGVTGYQNELEDLQKVILMYCGWG